MPVSSSAFPAPTTAVIACPVEDVAERQIALWHVHLIDHALLAECAERLVEILGPVGSGVSP
jgi:hypothetical protein